MAVEIARRMPGIKILTEDEIVSGPHKDVLRNPKYGFRNNTPLWYYILKEAEVAPREGKYLGPIGSYIVADEAAKIWKEQGLPGSLVLTTSANAVVAKKGSLAYDCSKAAANHLVRELAVELAPMVRVNGVAPATVVQGSAMFPRNPVSRFRLGW